MDLSDFSEDVKEKLENYTYLKDLRVLKDGVHLRYLNKNNPYKVKGGYFRKNHKGNILELYQGKKKWFIYLDQNYCFYQTSEEEKNPFKRFLVRLVKNNFSF